MARLVNGTEFSLPLRYGAQFSAKRKRPAAIVDTAAKIVYRRFAISFAGDAADRCFQFMYPEIKSAYMAIRYAPAAARQEGLFAVEPLDAVHFAAICKALGHPARVEIVRHLLARNTCICSELVTLLPLAQSTVSQHLRQLRDCGLIQGEIQGPRTCYCLDLHLLARFKHTIAQLGGASPDVSDSTA